MLGYRDSGMPDTEANARPDSFAQAPLDEAVGRLVAVIRRERPQVIITYPDEQSEYPHPDHLRVHEISMVAFDAAGDPTKYPRGRPPFAPSEAVLLGLAGRALPADPRQVRRAGTGVALRREVVGPLDTSDEPFTTAIDIAGFEDVRSDALKAHATQVDPNSPFWFGLPPEVLEEIYPVDQFFLAQSRVEGIRRARSDDLFAGVRT